jgi:biopolymer transport protein ExbD
MSRRQSAGCELDMTPMIDVTFQMIIFFVVTFKFTANVNPDIVLEQGPNAEAIKTNETGAAIVIEVDRRGWISLNGAQATASQLRAIVKNRFDRYGEFPVMIRGDYRTVHRDIRTVMDICTEIGLYKITFIAVKEPKGHKRSGG